ncbi:hypothetical protein IEQ34_014445 [Dendrobium chrysotoxum]|uniref:Uncharacterized protein n=1 Tax=Dendrobium chrysotoxum TaxID=161865 RepID=A0AAV7GLJ2_DENCH|nr:hypothetical protein IEQ34_014445 [Dendrobium chrysotoxum]
MEEGWWKVSAWPYPEFGEGVRQRQGCNMKAYSLPFLACQSCLSYEKLSDEEGFLNFMLYIEKFRFSNKFFIVYILEGNPMMHYNKGKSTGQKHFSDLLHELQASKNFPKGARSTRAMRPPLSLISKVNQVYRQLIFCDVDLQQCPAHKKRGVDIKSSKELYLKDSSNIASADPYQSNIGGISQKLKIPHSLICQNNAKSSIKYTLDRPPLTISCLLTNAF